MKDVNKLILIGRLGADPTMRETKSGNKVVNFSLATQRKFKRQGDDSSELETETQWHRVVSWGKQAESCAQYLKKGSTVFVEGLLKSRKYTSNEGVEKTIYEVHADEVNFLSYPQEQKAAT